MKYFSVLRNQEEVFIVGPQFFQQPFFFLRIGNLPAANKVTIFNRWGDVVFEKEKYDNDQRKFEGLNQNGHILPSGTYFYQIEFPDESNKRQTLTGYLSLKQ